MAYQNNPGSFPGTATIGAINAAPVPYLQENQQYLNQQGLTANFTDVVQQTEFTDSLQQAVSLIDTTNQFIGNGSGSDTSVFTDGAPAFNPYGASPTIGDQAPAFGSVASAGQSYSADGSGFGAGAAAFNMYGQSYSPANTYTPPPVDTSDPSSGYDPNFGNDYSGDDDDDFGPVILDLNGNGINIQKLSSSNTFFDVTGDGYENRTAWAGAGNGVLFVDTTGVGQLTQFEDARRIDRLMMRQSLPSRNA